MTMTDITATNPPGPTNTGTQFDPAKAEAFGGQMMGILAGGLLSLMVDVGHRTGLFATAAQGWATSDGSGLSIADAHGAKIAAHATREGGLRIEVSVTAGHRMHCHALSVKPELSWLIPCAH